MTVAHEVESSQRRQIGGPAHPAELPRVREHSAFHYRGFHGHIYAIEAKGRTWFRAAYRKGNGKVVGARAARATAEQAKEDVVREINEALKA